MIFYGTSSSRLKNGQLNNVECPNCNNQTSMAYSVFGKYAYLYWIPVFPIGKENVLECNTCNKTYKLKELPEKVKSRFENEKHNGIPLFHFSGLAIIVCIIAVIMYFNSKTKENELLYSQAPLIGDVYAVEGGNEGYYTTMKITEITLDSVYLSLNDYEVDKKSGTDDIDKDQNYNEEIVVKLSKEEIIELYSDETIYKITRD